jgi:Ras-related protein Rab-1A
MSYKATIGVDIFTKEIIFNTENVTLQIWDVAGQTSFRKFRQRFFSGSHGVLLVFDLTIPDSLNNIQLSWIKDIQEIAGAIPLVLIGNKVDLTELLAVSSEKITKFLDHNNNILDYYNTSALTGENVERAFRRLMEFIEL